MMHFHECLFVLDVKASGSYESGAFFFVLASFYLLIFPFTSNVTPP